MWDESVKSGTTAEKVRKRAGRPRRQPSADRGRIAEIDVATLDRKLKTVQRELSESRDRYTALYDSVPVGYVTLNKQGKILEANLTVASMLGIERGKLLKANISEFISPNFRSDFNLHLAAAFLGKGKHSCEVEMRTQEGRTLAIRLDAVVSGRHGDRRYQTTLTDITDQKKAENVLRWTTRTLGVRVQQQIVKIRLQAEAIAHLGEGVLITQGPDWPESKIVFVNRAMRGITGYTPVELIGQPRGVLWGSETNHDILNRIREKLSKGESCKAELVNYRKDGTAYDAELFVVPFPSSTGRSTTFVSIHRDVTEQKRAERQVEQYKRNLQRMSSELMLAEELERQRLAQDLHDSLGPALFSARRKLDQLSSRMPAVKDIAKALDDIRKIVQTLTFELSPPVLKQLGVKAAIKWLAQDIKSRYSLTVDVKDDGRSVSLDPRVIVVLFRAVRELVINIAKHAEAKSAIVSLTTSGHSLQVKIEDDGKGFDLAEQSGHVEKGHFGLFSVRERLEYLGGTFNIRSTPGKGTRVTVTVPMLQGKLTRPTRRAVATAQ
jgi:PAS domain S-box-containing protein